jgi:hypothetical protein
VVRFASFPSFFFPGLTSSSRRSRIHCFENVNVLIFLVAISEYDQTLYEDSDINRMNEAAVVRTVERHPLHEQDRSVQGYARPPALPRFQKSF